MALLIPGWQTFHDNVGEVNASGALTVYANQTTTRVTLYSDPDLTVAAATDANGDYPLNAGGRPATPLYTNSGVSYTIVELDSNGAQLRSNDDQFGWADTALDSDSLVVFSASASGDMANDLNAIFAAAAGKTLIFSNPQTYSFGSQLTIQAGTRVIFNGTILETTGSDLSSTNQVLIDDRVRIDWLRMNVPTGDTIRRMCAINGDDVEVERITITSVDQQDNDNTSPTTDAAFRINGDDCVVGLLEIDKFDHAALIFQNNNARIQGGLITSYKRAMKMDQSDGWYVDNLRCHTASPNAGATNRGNAVLIEQCRYWHLTNPTLAHMHSHAIRIGGTTTNETHNGVLSNVNIYEYGRCALKIKDGTNRIHDIMVNGIMATDGSFYTAGSANEDFIRLERCDNIHISGAQCKVDNTAGSAFYGVYLDNVTDVQIDGLDARDTIDSGIYLAEIEGGSFGIYINGVIRDAGADGVELDMSTGTHGRMNFDVFCTGQTGYGYNVDLSGTVSQVIRLAGQVQNTGSGILSVTGSDPDLVVNIEPTVGADTLTGPGAVPVGSQVTYVVTTGADALTLADGYQQQEKTIVMITDGGAGTLTPTNLANGATITFDDVGDSAQLKFLNGSWHFMGGTATLA